MYKTLTLYHLQNDQWSCILFYENIQSTNPSLPEFFLISLWLSLIITFEIDDFIVWFSEMISAIGYLFVIFTLNYRNVICHFLRRTCKAYKKCMCVFIMKRKLIKHSINIHKANQTINIWRLQFRSWLGACTKMWRY